MRLPYWAKPVVWHEFRIYVPDHSVQHTWSLTWFNRQIKIKYSSPLRKRHLRGSKR